MINKIKKYILKNKLFTHKDRILITVSGGADSVFLLYVLHNLGYKTGIAHCNFKLRKEESDKDEIFVKKIAEKLKIQFHKTSFNTPEFAKKNKYSIEEAARILRYEWFEKIRKLHKYQFIATGHHAGDNIETFFIKLTNGTGIKGLSGIKPKNNKIVRPLLSVTRQEIEEYCKQNNISFRTDASNFDTKFTRNKFRHNILPLFSEINGAFEKNMIKNLEIINDIQKIYNLAIENAKEKCLENKNNNTTEISINCLENQIAPKTFLFEFLRDFGFNSSQTNSIYLTLNNTEEKHFFSEKFELIKDKKKLIIIHKKNKKTKVIEIKNDIAKINNNLLITFEKILYDENFTIEKNQNIAYFDADKLKFPLKIRTRKQGDFFHPFGMKGKKLLSDYFTDLKLNSYEKDNTFLLISGNDIIWVIGKRTDDRYKITKNTKHIYIAKLQAQ